jgi:hypothetical protein
MQMTLPPTATFERDRNCSASSRMLETWAIWSSSPQCTGNARSSPAIGSNHASIWVVIMEESPGATDAKTV